jgi:signal transduction histidine kinase/DNA-binding NarL/FixJ family response regulator
MARILAIDDKPDNLLVLKAVLKNYLPDCILITALSGREGLKKIDEELPDVIISDIKMPGMDGFEVCRILKSDPKANHIPIVMLTAVHTDSKSKSLGLEAGADAFLTKPIEENELVAQIKAMLRIKKSEDLLRQEKASLASQVRKRTKELKCLYNISNITGNREMAFDLIVQDIVNVIPPAMQYSEIACARIVLDQQEFKTENFKITNWVQKCDIILHENKLGVVEVYYLEEKNGNEDPFLDEEHRLIGEIADRLRKLVVQKIDAEEKIKTGNKLQHAQKMEAIGTLAGGIAHDFNNILGAIIGYAEIARDDSPKESSVVEDLDKVLEASDRAVGLVRQILAFSRQDETEHILLHPSAIVKKTVSMLRPTLPTTIEITQDFDPETGFIFADPTQIHQILMNLCTNAFHAMEKTGGRLDISIKEIDLRDGDLSHEPDVIAGTFIQLSVCDSGPGITPEIKNKIFDPYFTTKKIGKGTGLGLSIIHGIIKSYGGFITLSSELGKGTVFHVFIPVVNEEDLPAKEAIKQIPIGIEKILFIDDEEILADLGKNMLERLGYHVTVRKSSLEALETFQNQPDQFDVVITDQTMPGMTGVDLARRMLQIRPDIPIILCTGYSSIISEEKAKFLGIKEFALKPLTKKTIATLIRKVLDT